MIMVMVTGACVGWICLPGWGLCYFENLCSCLVGACAVVHGCVC